MCGKTTILEKSYSTTTYNSEPDTPRKRGASRVWNPPPATSSLLVSASLFFSLSPITTRARGPAGHLRFAPSVVRCSLPSPEQLEKIAAAYRTTNRRTRLDTGGAHCDVIADAPSFFIFSIRAKNQSKEKINCQGKRAIHKHSTQFSQQNSIRPPPPNVTIGPIGLYLSTPHTPARRAALLSPSHTGGREKKGSSLLYMDAHPTKLSRSFSSIDPMKKKKRKKKKKSHPSPFVVVVSLRGIFFISSSCFLYPPTLVRWYVFISHTQYSMRRQKGNLFFSLLLLLLLLSLPVTLGRLSRAAILPTIHQGLYYFLPTFSHTITTIRTRP